MARKALFYIFITVSALTLGACGSSSDGVAPATAPSTPANPGAAPGDQRVTVTWDSTAGATSYNVYWSTVSGTGTGGTMENVTTNTFYHDGVANGTDYYYVVTAVNAVGQSSATAEVTATPVDILLSSLSFTDTNLQACINALVGPTFVHDLTSLTCNSSSIADITGIEALTSLTELYLHNNTITDVSALASLTSLTYLWLYSNTITDISPLAGLTSLRTLRLSNNSITDVSALASMNSLTQLYLGDNTGLTAANINALLPSLTSLSVLYLWDLGIDNAGLSTLAPNLTGLTRLNLDRNTIIDVSPLAGLTGLTYLYLQNNSIGGQGVGNVDSLMPLTSAIEINLSSNIGMSCTELGTLIGTLGSPPVDTDNNSGTTDVATDGVNCTNP